MADKSDIDAQKVLEKVRAAKFPDSVSAELLQAVYALEHEKQFEDERGSVRAALRHLVADAVKESS